MSYLFTRSDGTRVYTGGKTYKPVPEDQRKYGRRKPDDPRAVYFNGKWFLPLELLDDAQRELPETRPDTDAYDHAHKRPRCRCEVCKRPEALRWVQKWHRDQMGAGSSVSGSRSSSS